MRRFAFFLLATAVVTGLASCTRSGATSSTPSNGAGSTQEVTIDMLEARTDHEAVLLANGTVLLIGGNNGGSAVSSIESYIGLIPANSPRTQLAGSMLQGRYNFSAVLLNSGLVFIAGGNDGAGNSLFTTELFNPATGISASGPNLTTSRYGHVGFVYANGAGQERVALCGGLNISVTGQTALLDFEIYDPGANSIATGGNMADYCFFGEPVSGGASFGIGSGFRVDSVGNILTHGLQTFDPSTGTFTAQSWVSTGSTEKGSAGVAGTSGGDIYLAGGTNAAQSAYSDEVFMFNGTVSVVGTTLQAERSLMTSTLLGNDEVAFIGGYDGFKARNDVEIFDGSSTSNAQRLVLPRFGHTATLLQSGDVLVAGGTNGFRIHGQAELVDTNAPASTGGGGGGGAFSWSEDFETVPPANARDWSGSSQPWEFGAPGTSGPATAPSGTNIAGTDLNADYSDAAAGTFTGFDYISLEFFNIDLSAATGTLTYTVELYYDLGDGDVGNVLVYDASGTFFQELTLAAASQLQYNTTSPANGVNAFDQNAGNSGQWITVEADVSGFIGVPDLIIAFDLEADGAGTSGPGLFLDDAQIQ